MDVFGGSQRLFQKNVIWPDHDTQEQITRMKCERSGLQICGGIIDGTYIA